MIKVVVINSLDLNCRQIENTAALPNERIQPMKFAFLITAVLLLSLNVHSQSKTKARKQSRPASPTYATSEISPETSSLPPGFLGHSPSEIFAKLYLRMYKFKKSEFETTAQYNARIEKEKAAPLIGTLTMQSNLAFSFSKPTVQYDADQSTLSVSLDGISVNGNADTSTYREFTGLIWSSIERKVGAYIGTNAFGIKKRVQAWRDTKIIVGISKEFISPITSFNPTACSFTVDSEQAKVLKQTARILVIGKLINPYIKEEESEDKATITDPIHVIYASFLVYIQPVAVVIYDDLTGKVFFKQSVPDAAAVASKTSKPSPPPTPTPTPNPIRTENQSNLTQPMTASLRPTILYRERAQYTQIARDNKIQGTVVLMLTYNADATISDIQVVRGLPYGLTEQAIASVKKIRFQPAMKNGVPVSVRGNVEFNFTLY